MHVPPCLHGDGEHDRKPEAESIRTIRNNPTMSILIRVFDSPEVPTGDLLRAVVVVVINDHIVADSVQLGVVSRILVARCFTTIRENPFRRGQVPVQPAS